MIWQQPEKQSLDRPIIAAAQLLVEGRTPEMFFRELVNELELSHRVDVRTFGSIGRLRPYLELFTSKPKFKEIATSLGIVRDAEAQPAHSAFQSICSALMKAALPAPDMMRIFSGPPLRIGVYVLPDCEREGMLETLCLEAAEECEGTTEQKVLPCADEFLICAERAKTEYENRTKARFAAYALARGVAEAQLGRAAQKRVIPCHAKAFERLTRFLNELAA